MSTCADFSFPPFQGKHCEKCKPLFVGSAKGGGTCRPCREFCRGNSAVCLSRDEHKKALESAQLFPLDPNNVSVCYLCGLLLIICKNKIHQKCSHFSVSGTVILLGLHLSLSINQIQNWVSEGPTEENAVCVNCQNNSVGDKCESCLSGYFLLQGKCDK